MNIKDVKNNLFAFVYRKLYQVPVKMFKKRRNIVKALRRIFFKSTVMFKLLLLKSQYFKKIFASLKRRYYLGMRAFTRRKYNPDRKSLYLDSRNFKPLWYGLPSRSYYGDVLVDLTRFIYQRGPWYCHNVETSIKKIWI